MNNLTKTLLGLIIIAIAVSAYLYFRQTMSQDTTPVPAENLPAVNKVKTFQSAKGYGLEYTDEFKYYREGFANNGDGEGIFCIGADNHEKILNDQVGEIQIENCLVITTLAKNQKINSIEAYSDTFFPKKLYRFGSETYDLKSKEQIELGGKLFIKAIYIFPENAEMVEYAVMKNNGQIMNFSFYAKGKKYYSEIEKMLSTLAFK